VSSNGTIGTAMNPTGTAPYTPPNGTYWNAPVVYVSSDGSTAITQFGTDIYSLPIAGGNITDLIQGNALFGVSPDGKYSLSTPTPAGFGYIILYTYGLTSTTPTAEPQLTRLNVLSNRALWLNNDEYALSILDSIGLDSLIYSHVIIYDAQGDSLWSIANADVRFSVSAFAPGSGDIFVRTSAMGIDRINMNTRVRTHIVTNDTVYSMDVSADGTVLVYCSNAGSTNGTLPAYVVNTANGDKGPSFASNVNIPRISPKHDMVACITLQSGANSNINVYPLNTPP
jgi:hypothetical protein